MQEKQEKSEDKAVIELEEIPETQRNTLFDSLLLDLTAKDAQLLTEYRNIRQKMLDLGITEENMDEYLYKLRSMESEYKILNAEYAEISNSYRNISRLETNIDFANNPKFARGPFFDREKEIEPEVTVTSKDINGEDKKITDEIEKDAALTPDMWDERR